MIFSRWFFVNAVCVGLIALLASGCDPNGIKVRGFILPPGDAEKGQVTFVKLGCPACHTVSGAEIPQPEGASFAVPLGGKVIQVKHYGDLLTSVVNPNHRVFPQYDEATSTEAERKSPMPDFTQTMSVKQLIDVVEFLHGKYEKMPNYGGKYYYYQ